MFFGFLLVSSLLCTLVTGFVFTYAIVVMPGFGKLNDREFIQAFQATDGIIQNNQPLFILVWVGSIIGPYFPQQFAKTARQFFKKQTV